MDIFDTKNIKPMLLSEVKEPFDSPEYIYELKLDGIRCIAYLDGQGTELRNKRNLRLNATYPELKEIHKQTNTRCILDGELLIMREGKPDFFEIQRRSLMSDKFRIELAAAKLPVSFTAYDILYTGDRQITDLPLMERKKILDDTVLGNQSLSVSRYIEGKGVNFYNLTVRHELEGIVAKQKDSKYYFDKRSKDWIKIKNLLDDDFVVCGYMEKEQNVTSIILGQYDNGRLMYKGHVTLGVSSRDFGILSRGERLPGAPFTIYPAGNEGAIWLKPQHVCTVKYMMKTGSGGLRQPVFKGLREDKRPEECITIK